MKSLSIFMSQFNSVSVSSGSLQPHGLQHARLPCPSPTPGVCSNSCPLSRWCHPTVSSSVIAFSSCPQSFPASGSFPMSWPFASGGQSTGVSASASVFPINIQGQLPLGLTGLISLQSKGLSRVFSSTRVIQLCHTPFPVLNKSVFPCKVLTVASWPAYRFLRRQVRWSVIPISLRIFHSSLWSTQSKAFG